MTRYCCCCKPRYQGRPHSLHLFGYLSPALIFPVSRQLASLAALTLWPLVFLAVNEPSFLPPFPPKRVLLHAHFDKSSCLILGPGLCSLFPPGFPAVPLYLCHDQTYVTLCGTMRALTPAPCHLNGQVSLLISPYLPIIPPPNTPCRPIIAFAAITA
jgi:hypothetical protein